MRLKHFGCALKFLSMAKNFLVCQIFAKYIHPHMPPDDIFITVSINKEGEGLHEGLFFGGA